MHASASRTPPASTTDSNTTTAPRAHGTGRDGGHAPDHARAGPWLAGRASAWGGEQGLVATQNDDDLNALTSRAGDRVGKFTFRPHVPEGGFYGAHLLVARLVWGTQGHEARLTEWFEAVGPNGEPVTKPSYLIVLTVDSREYPHRRG